MSTGSISTSVRRRVHQCVFDDRSFNDMSFRKSHEKYESSRKQWIIKVGRDKNNVCQITDSQVVNFNDFEQEDFEWTPLMKASRTVAERSGANCRAVSKTSLQMVDRKQLEADEISRLSVSSRNRSRLELIPRSWSKAILNLADTYINTNIYNTYEDRPNTSKRNRISTFHPDVELEIDEAIEADSGECLMLNLNKNTEQSKTKREHCEKLQKLLDLSKERFDIDMFSPDDILFSLFTGFPSYSGFIT